MLFCLRNITPLGGVAGTAEVVLDAVAKSPCCDFLSVFVCILLRPKHYGLTAILSVDAVDDFIQPPLLLVCL